MLRDWLREREGGKGGKTRQQNEERMKDWPKGEEGEASTCVCESLFLSALPVFLGIGNYVERDPTDR